MALALKEIHPTTYATERQLVRAVRDGDDRAFEQLFSRYRRRISAYVYGMLNDHGRAEDITQEVFISALRRLRDTDGPISFKPWIYEIARNACIDEFRRSSRASLISLDAGLGPEGPVMIDLADHTTPEVRFQRKQQMGDLFGAFSNLSDNHHRILVLRELEGLSYGEIGQRMGMSRPMVESTLFRARRRLTQEYDELASGRRCLEVQAAVAQPESRALHGLGIRERRRIARHLHHCQDCLRFARLAGVDQQALEVPGIAQRVAALLPFGWIRIAWDGGKARLHNAAAAGSAQHASPLGESTPQAVAAGRAAVAAAALLITGGTLVPMVSPHSSARAATPPTRASSPSSYPTTARTAPVRLPALTPSGARVRSAMSRAAVSPKRQAGGAQAKRGATGPAARVANPVRHSHGGAPASTSPSSGSSTGAPQATGPAGSSASGTPQGTPSIQHTLSSVSSTSSNAANTTINGVGNTANQTLNTVGDTISKVTGGGNPVAPPPPSPSGGSASSDGAGGSAIPGLNLQVPNPLPSH